MVKKSVKKSQGKDPETELLRNQLARALADYDNFRKRIESEKEDFTKIANLKLVIRLLGVYDMLNEVQKHLNDAGLAMTIKEFENVLNEEGVKKIVVAKGDVFDENLHEAVEIVEGKEKGIIAEIVLTGWEYEDGKIIRPSKVKVTKGEN